MIHTDEQLRRNREALLHVEAALAALHRQQPDMHPNRFALMAEPVLDELHRLRAEIDEYIGLNDATKGTIEILGKDISKLHGKAERDIQGRTGVQFQDGALFSSLSVSENIIVPVREHAGLDEQTMREIAALKVALVGLPPDTGDKKPSELSGGMRKRASLARALALDPELLFLDEPTAGMSQAETNQTMDLVRRIAKDFTILIVEHDMKVVMQLCHRITVLHYGEILAEGTPEQIQENPRVLEVYLKT